jgi:hypothetical protein
MVTTLYVKSKMGLNFRLFSKSNNKATDFEHRENRGLACLYPACCLDTGASFRPMIRKEISHPKSEAS